MASKKSEKAILKQIKQIHESKWGAPLGQRKCMYNLSDDCLKVDDEEKFKGHRCKACLKQMQRERYHIRMAAAIKARGYPKQKPGPQKKVENSDSE